MLRAGDVHKFEDEEARLTSMHNLLNHVGFSEDIYEDFVEEAFGLLQKLANSMGAMDGAAADILLQTFNDYGTAMAIITYFKLLASAWIQSNPNDYQPFLLDYPDLKTYCQHNIEASNCEIDHVAMNALTEAIVKPAGFGLEVLYLDRSAGAEINTHRVDPTSPEGYPLANAPTMRLLYRPGHYDILYKAEDFPPPVASQGPIHVALAGYSDGFVPNSIHPSGINDVMAFIPGMSYPTGLGQRWPPVSYDYTPNPAPQPQVAPVPAYTPTPTPAAPVASSHQEYVAPVHASHVNHHPPASHHTLHLEPPVTLPIHPPPAPPPLSIERGPPVNVERGGPFRPSMYEFEPGFGAGQVHSLPFQTSIFRNSHYNTAHFLNPDFQPEEWSPDSEYSAGNRGRHKSASQ
jgi:ubiquitin thioesterase protein OTUB1